MRPGKKWKRIVFTIYILAVHVLAGYLLVRLVFERYVARAPTYTSFVDDPTAKEEIPTPLPVPSVFADSTPTQTENTETPNPGALIIPVEGVRPDQLTDTFAESRAEGRVHDAIDIPAPAGTRVMAAADGEIIKFFDSLRGGTTIYQASTDSKFIYYYAHLQRRADDIKEGDTVKQGQTIGYVGDTGNAGAGNYHLHFSIAIAGDPKRYWEGTYIDPYPYLKNGLSPSLH